MDASIEELEARIVACAKSDERMRRLQQIPGVGPLITHALVMAVGDARRFDTARDCAAWIGLTPPTNNSAEKTRIGHISRQGDHSLRRLLGARRHQSDAPGQSEAGPGQCLGAGHHGAQAVQGRNRRPGGQDRSIAWAMLRSGDNY